METAEFLARNLQLMKSGPTWIRRPQLPGGGAAESGWFRARLGWVGRAVEKQPTECGNFAGG
jgi:hypothetical protein